CNVPVKHYHQIESAEQTHREVDVLQQIDLLIHKRGTDGAFWIEVTEERCLTFDVNIAVSRADEPTVFHILTENSKYVTAAVGIDMLQVLHYRNSGVSQRQLARCDAGATICGPR